MYPNEQPFKVVSTHSRPKAAAKLMRHRRIGTDVSTHSRPKAAAGSLGEFAKDILVSTHSRPKAAAYFGTRCCCSEHSFNTQPPEGGCRQDHPPLKLTIEVSTHSRPKAAAYSAVAETYNTLVFQHTAARRRLL